jgi:hypothetical protein
MTWSSQNDIAHLTELFFIQKLGICFLPQKFQKERIILKEFGL